MKESSISLGDSAEQTEVGDKAVKISAAHYKLLRQGREKINADPRFTRNVTIRRYVEKLVEDFWEDCIPDLTKEREGSRDWLELEYKKISPGVPFYDWLKAELQKGSGAGRSAKPKPRARKYENEPLAVGVKND